MGPYRLRNADTVGEMLKGDTPFAVLDVREQGEFSREHLLLASSAPLSRLELLVEDLVPCKATPIILVDAGIQGARAKRAAVVLQQGGYADLTVLEGGIKAWRERGFVTVTGVGSLSKGFGEYIESVTGTPCLSPEDVQGRLARRENMVLIDVRPVEEYRVMTIPGSVNAPGCELLYRFQDIVPDPQSLVLVNCAGRTRSIIGAQTLRNAGVPNPVAALKGGTMNWRLSGFTLEYGAQRRTAPPSASALAFARASAASVAERCGVAFVDADTVRRWQDEASLHPLFLFDVRQPGEYESGHFPGSRNAPGGQLVQATDEYAAVRNARFVLIDDTEVRAIMTAHWLMQMGLPLVHVLKGGLGGSGLGTRGLQSGPAPERLLACEESGAARSITAQELERLLAASPALGPLLINVGASVKHRQAHIPGAVWTPRAFLERAFAARPDARHVILTADTEQHARLAALDAARLWSGASVYYLTQGTPGWQQVTLPCESGMPEALSPEEDIWYRPYQDPNASPEAMRGYFDWEFGLVRQIQEDNCVRFAAAMPPQYGQPAAPAT